jgi:hypothetical protein
MRPLTIASMVLYVLAAIVFVLGAYLGLSFASAPAAIRGATIAFQTPELQPLWDGLASGLAFVGIVLFVISLTWKGFVVYRAATDSCYLFTNDGMVREVPRV